MFRINILTERTIYKLGELVEGELWIRTNESIYFDCIDLILTIKEKTEIQRFIGPERHILVEGFIHHKETKLLKEQGITEKGTMKIPFSIQLPKEFPPTFIGLQGNIEYTFTANIRRSQVDDMVYERSIVVNTINRHPPKNLELHQHQWFDCKLAEENSFCIGKKIKVLVQMKKPDNINKLRLDLICIDNSIANKLRKKVEKSISFVLLDPDEVSHPSNHWMELILDIPEDSPQSLRSELIDCRYELSIRSVSFRKDEGIRIPIELQKCSQ